MSIQKPIRVLTNILENIRLTQQFDSTESTIIIGGVHADAFSLTFHFMLAYMFYKLGIEVHVLVDDGILPHIDSIRVSEGTIKDVQQNCKNRKKIKNSELIHFWYQKILKYSNNKFSFIYYSDIVNSLQDMNEQFHTELRLLKAGYLSKNVDASHKRYFGGRDFDLLNDLHLEYAKMSIINEYVNKQVAYYILKQFKPNLFITLDGVYTTTGPLVDVMEEYNVPVLVYKPNKFQDRGICITNKNNAIDNVGKNWNDFELYCYNDELKHEAKTFMDKRLKFDVQNISANSKWINLIKNKKQKYLGVVCLFPNLTWDGVIRDRDIVFNGIGLWLKETIEWVRDKNILLVMREHPQSKLDYNYYESSISLLQELIPDINNFENVILINGRDPVSSYQLVQSVIDCSIIYNGTLGVEIPYMGKPVIIVANSPYSHKDVGYEPKSKKSYFDNILKIIRNDIDYERVKKIRYENALKVAAYQFIHISYYCPIMPTIKSFLSEKKYWQSWDLDAKYIDPANSPNWARTIKRFLEPILDGKIISFRKNNLEKDKTYISQSINRTKSDCSKNNTILDLDNLMVLGEELSNKGIFNEAEQIFQDIIKFKPNHAIAHSNLGCIFWQTNRKQEALSEFNIALKLMPDDRNIVWNTGQALFKIGLVDDVTYLYSSYIENYSYDIKMDRFLQTCNNSKEHSKTKTNYAWLLAPNIMEKELESIKNRFIFYLPEVPFSSVNLIKKLSLKAQFDNKPVLYFGDSHLAPNTIKNNREKFFNIDYRYNPTDGWDWCRLASYCSRHKANIEKSNFRFQQYINKLKNDNLNKTYIFGTGPSLNKAIDRDWSDGYRIVCNTIVRDQTLWKHISPHFIVAGDAIYHFGHTLFAKQFRHDLLLRLSETETLFVYPEIFHEIVRREFEEFREKLVPIPKGNYQKINVDLRQNFILPSLHNVLGLLLLPLACTLSKNIYLWGFDGRAPDDKLFWSNSKKHSYPELIPKLQKAHPCFFNHFVPKADTGQYIQIAFGDLLDKLLLQAESEGFTFAMMHQSWTPNLQKRYQKKNSVLL